MKSFLLLLSVFIVSYGCVSNDHCDGSGNTTGKLGTIKFRATESALPFNGALELFPCSFGTSIYFGNYYDGVLKVINPSYLVSSGAITATARPLLLPLGRYNMIYWGVDNASIYADSYVNSPTLSIGIDFATSYWSLRLNPDGTTYKPVLSQVMAVQDVNIGDDDVSVSLNRMVAGLTVIVQNKNNQPLDAAISAIKISVSGVAQRINVVTGEPDDQTATVNFGLTISSDRSQATNLPAMLYPSIDNPPFIVDITLANGEVKTYSTTLDNALTAGVKQTVTITLDMLTSGTSDSTGFTVSDWTEVTQTIDPSAL